MTNNTYHKTTLKNNLRIITVPMSHVASVTAMIVVGAGSRYEQKHTNGLSHFLEHMAFKGTTNRPSSLAISSEIDAIGGAFNAFTSKDHTGFFIKSRAAHLPKLLDVLSDMLLNSLFKQEEIEREKGVIIEEINMYEDLPMRKIGDVFESLLYGNHPLGWDIAGTRETVSKIGRDDFISYVTAVYMPNNAVVVVAGGVKEKDVIKPVENMLGSWRRKKIQSYKKFTQDCNPHGKPQVEVVSKKTEQAHLCIGVRAYPIEHPRRYAQTVLATILGGGMSSRLFIEVRERRGLAYYVRADNSRYTDVGNFVVQAGVDKNRITDAISVILEQLARIALEKNGIADKELKKAKEYLKGRLILELEDSRSVAGLYATQEILLDKVVTPEEKMMRVDKVTRDDVVAVASDLFRNEKLNLAVIGPFKGKGKFEKLLRL